LRTVTNGCATSSEYTLNPQPPRVKREPFLRIWEKSGRCLFSKTQASPCQECIAESNPISVNASFSVPTLTALQQPFLIVAQQQRCSQQNLHCIWHYTSGISRNPFPERSKLEHGTFSRNLLENQKELSGQALALSCTEYDKLDM